ncbi:MAG: type VI secretion system baseplate subunit TssE [Hyphomicrobiales bacterium]|nr:type VI secretion system baseplate subunit TssE [Hyphomicrobiales bacterium]
MANPNRDRVAAPLMRAFRAAHAARDATAAVDIRDGGERVIASRRVTARAPISEGELRRLVHGDLVDLLNTTNLGSAEDLTEAPEVRKSVLNFGMPDLARRTLLDNANAEIGQEIENALMNFEPRLVRKSIKARRDEAVAEEELRLRFLVSAELRLHPANAQMNFVAEVELDSGKIRLDRV